jgi:curved DNA-binding protein CbpA
VENGSAARLVSHRRPERNKTPAVGRAATFRDLYEILGVDRDAGEDELREAYREQARRLHPDVSDDPDAETRFAELTHAYDVLSRPTSRLLYDRLAYRGPGGGGFGPVHPTVGRPTRESAHLSDAELAAWIFSGEARPDASIPPEPRLVRYVAAFALLLALAVLAVLVAL